MLVSACAVQNISIVALLLVLVWLQVSVLMVVLIPPSVVSVWMLVIV